MRKWVTAFTLVLTMLLGVVGVGAHAGEGDCPMANMPDCCKKAQSASKTPEVSMARLCCKLNCSESGSTGSSTGSSFSTSQNTTPIVAVVPKPMPSADELLRRLAHSPQLKDSIPKYIQHLALLI